MAFLNFTTVGMWENRGNSQPAVFRQIEKQATFVAWFKARRPTADRSPITFQSAPTMLRTVPGINPLRQLGRLEHILPASPMQIAPLAGVLTPTRAPTWLAAVLRQGLLMRRLVACGHLP